MPKKKNIYFQKSWLYQEQYKDWLAEAPEDTNAICRIFRKLFKLTNMATDSLK